MAAVPDKILFRFSLFYIPLVLGRITEHRPAHHLPIRTALLPNSIRDSLPSPPAPALVLTLSHIHAEAQSSPVPSHVEEDGDDGETRRRAGRPLVGPRRNERNCIYLWFGGLSRAECGVNPPRAHCGFSCRLVVVVTVVLVVVAAVGSDSGSSSSG